MLNSAIYIMVKRDKRRRLKVQIGVENYFLKRGSAYIDVD
jgi:hypothetical protein